MDFAPDDPPWFRRLIRATLWAGWLMLALWLLPLACGAWLGWQLARWLWGG